MSQSKSNEDLVKAIRPELLPTEAEMDLYERRVIELLAQKDAELAEAVRGCQISNFVCSSHGKVMPNPVCPKCVMSKENQ